MSLRSLIAASGLSILVLALTCARRPSANLLLVTFDTTRADRIGCYGCSRASTPTLDRLAAQGVRFSRCFTTAPVTLPAHSSLFTGLYPLVHGVRDNGLYRLDEEALTLAEILAASGFETAAFIGSYVLASRFGLAQGFSHYDERLEPKPNQPAAFFVERTADKVTDAAIEWFKNRRSGRPFAVWLHYFDPHAPYRPPAPFDSIYAQNPYDGEIAFADRELGRFVEFLKNSGQYDNTLIAVAGDHGEALGEHGEPTHGIFLYNATLRVPLILRFPGDDPAGLEISREASLVDVMPTLLDRLGLKAPAGLQGQSLMPLVRQEPQGGTDSLRELYLETHLPENTFGWHALEGMLQGRRKYIQAPLAELYDLEADPGEQHNLAGSDSLALRKAANRFLIFRSALTSGVRTFSGRLVLDSESAQRLRALGYVSSAGGRAPGQEPPDPKTMIHTLGKFLVGVLAEAERDYAKAREVFETVLAEDPENIYARLYLGFVCMEQGEYRRAVDEFRQAVERKPDCPANYLLGLAYIRLGSLDSARVWLTRTIELNPSHALACAWLGEVFSRQGNEPEALARLETARRLAPQDKEILNDLGKMLLDRGQTERAAGCFEAALKVDSLYPLALYNLGIASYRLGRLEQAGAALAKVAQRFKKDEKVQLNLGVVLAARGELKAAGRAYERAIQADSTYAPAYNNLGNLSAARGDPGQAERNYLKAVALDSTYAEAWLNLGLLYQHEHPGVGKARSCLERALTLQSGAPWAERVQKILQQNEAAGGN